MKLQNKLISLMLAAAMMVSFSVPVLASDEDITIFYTNDIHTYIDNHLDAENGLTYSKAAALKDSIPDAILVDAGDHLQGTAYGEMDQGMTMIKLMNEAGYDLATFGNHEFDEYEDFEAWEEWDDEDEEEGFVMKITAEEAE